MTLTLQGFSENLRKVNRKFDIFFVLYFKTYEMKIQPVFWLQSQMQCEKFTQ